MRAVLSASEANATVAPATKLQSYESVKSQCRKSVLPAVIKEYREKCSLEMLQPLTQGQNLTIVGQDRTHTTHSHTDAHWYTLSKTIRIVWWGIFRAKLSGGEISATDGWTFFFSHNCTWFLLSKIPFPSATEVISLYRPLRVVPPHQLPLRHPPLFCKDKHWSNTHLNSALL